MFSQSIMKKEVFIMDRGTLFQAVSDRRGSVVEPFASRSEAEFTDSLLLGERADKLFRTMVVLDTGVNYLLGGMGNPRLDVPPFASIVYAGSPDLEANLMDGPVELLGPLSPCQAKKRLAGTRAVSPYAFIAYATPKGVYVSRETHSLHLDLGRMMAPDEAAKALPADFPRELVNELTWPLSVARAFDTRAYVTVAKMGKGGLRSRTVALDRYGLAAEFRVVRLETDPLPPLQRAISHSDYFSAHLDQDERTGEEKAVGVLSVYRSSAQPHHYVIPPAPFDAGLSAVVTAAPILREPKAA